MKSVFTDKIIQPSSEDLKTALGNHLENWLELEQFTLKYAPHAIGEWHFSGEKFGWSYRIKDRKRVLVYLLPRVQFFKVALVFGDKALTKINESSVLESIKTELNAAKKYAEGRGIRLEVTDQTTLPSIKQLIMIKIEN
ncbi:MAG: DUF3788 family protein [Fluviicola sp.]|nr:DUF3788 family protein [Fluviicola sp.]